jgi:uncharacterized membrane protein
MQDPQVFEGLHMLNSVTSKHKLLAWVNKIEHHVQHRTVGVCLTVATIPLLTSTLKQSHLQKTTAIRASLLRQVHYIFYHPNTFLGHPNIAQTTRG